MPRRRTMIEAPLHPLTRAIEAHARLVAYDEDSDERAGAVAALTHAEPVKHPARSQRRDKGGKFA